jgi:hypothetical protein
MYMKKHIMWGVWLLGATCFSFSAYAQNKVKAPMEDVNQVVDLTLDSLNKAKTARPVALSPCFAHKQKKKSRLPLATRLPTLCVFSYTYLLIFKFQR